MRTLISVPLIFGSPSGRWGAKPFITYPIRIGLPVEKRKAEDETAPEHTIILANRWASELSNDESLSPAQIAKREGFSRARVCQILALHRLPKPVKRHLESLTSKAEVRFFSERKLRKILSEEDNEHCALFEELQRSWQKRQN